MTNTQPQSSISPHFSSLHPRLIKGLEKLGFFRATPIQESCLPPALAGRDLMACAETGSGKTAAFLLPIMHQLLVYRDQERQEKGEWQRQTRALILAPTRELAAQISEHFEDLGTYTNLGVKGIFGGVKRGPQERSLKSGVDVVVATPGRLLDHLACDYASFMHLEFLVLDEADRMLDMGFLPDIKRIIARLPKNKKQSMLFSATMPAQIVQLARSLLDNPVSIAIDEPPAAVQSISHLVYPVPDRVKQHLLLKILKNHSVSSAIIFTRTKHRANRLHDYLITRGVSCGVIHANRSQAQRTYTMKAFKAGEITLLIASDIVARGIDVQALSHVISFDAPQVPQDYIHRTGRTGRANLSGEAISLISPQEEYNLKRIESLLGEKLPRRKIDDFDYDAQPKEALEIPLSIRLAAYRAQRSSRPASRRSTLR